MLVDVFNLGHLRGEDRIARVLPCELAQELERAARLVLVPQIDHLELIVRLALEQAPVGPGAHHLCESLLAAATREQEEKAQDLRHGGRHVGVVAIQPDTEIGVVEIGVEHQRALERVLDALAVARRGQAFFAQHEPLHAGRVRPAQVEPGLGIVGGANGPGVGRADGAFDRGRKLLVERAAVRIELDAPPERGGGEHVTRLGRRRAAGHAELRFERFESGVEDEVVGADEAGFAAQTAGDVSGGRRGQAGSVMPVRPPATRPTPRAAPRGS